jgi:hypothetical protein
MVNGFLPNYCEISGLMEGLLGLADYGPLTFESTGPKGLPGLLSRAALTTLPAQLGVVVV